MSNRTRALVIGLIGPVLSAAGLVWVLLAAALERNPESADFRYFLFDSPHLMIAVGVVASALLLPIALAVRVAAPEDVELPVFDAEREDAEAPEGRHPYGWSHE
jgi:hypothetical protein